MSIGNNKSSLSSVILIPFWIAEAVQRQGLQLSDLVDYEKIRPALSMHDMATFMAMQYEQGLLFYADPRYTDGFSDLIRVWGEHTHAWTVDPAYPLAGKKPSQDYGQVSQYSFDSSVKADVEGRLYGENVKMARYDHAYDAVVLTRKVIGIIIYPGYFSNTVVDLRLQQELICKVREVSYGQGAQHEELSSTPLFKRHLELLSGD